MKDEQLLEILCYHALIRMNQAEMLDLKIDSMKVNNQRLSTSDIVKHVNQNQLIINLLNKGRSSILSSEDKIYLLNKLLSSKTGIIEAFEQLKKTNLSLKHFGVIVDIVMNTNDNDLLEKLINFIPKDKVQKIQCKSEYKQTLIMYALTFKLADI